MLERAHKWWLEKFRPVKFKELHELEYWQGKREQEGTLKNDHYVAFYTTHFGLGPDDYRDKCVLDIGCGPRGSLEWASMAKERVGLDPLADSYKRLGADKHQMRYVAAGSEKMPFSDAYFDVVCSFNSIDHVEDLDATIREIARVTKPGGFFLLLTELNHDRTACEPQEFSWDVVERFEPAFDVVDERHYEISTVGMYQSIDKDVRYDHADEKRRPGILSVKLRRLVQ